MDEFEDKIRKKSFSPIHVLPLQYHHLLAIEGIVRKYVTSVSVNKDLHLQISGLYLILGETNSKILRDILFNP